MSTQAADSAVHPIQVVASRTGISTHVLRAWEKRYGTVRPTRSATGRRLYSDADIARLRLIRDTMAGGRRIGDVAYLTLAELERLVAEDRAQAGGPAPPSRGTTLTEPAFLPQALAAVRRADQDGLRALLSRAIVVLTPARFIEELATPLMHQVGALWERGELSPGHEHAATEAMRRVLIETLDLLQSPNGGPALLVGTPSGQRHEIGALLAATVAALEGWRVTYLGADLPARDIGRVALDARAAAVAVSITAPDPDTPGEIAALREAVGPDLPILVGGQQAAALNGSAHRVITVGDLESFRGALRALTANS
jgi:DNA-binding transcriptional MerR regulator/methylmalonyl-CoA mutase cobalamin-binding subunit